jgi:hypothetical protein
VRQYLYALPAESWASPAASGSAAGSSAAAAALSEKRRKNAFRRQSSAYGLSLPSIAASPGAHAAQRRPSFAPQTTPTSSPRPALKALPDNGDAPEPDSPEQLLKAAVSVRLEDTSASPSRTDPLVRVRKAALLLLSDLRDLEQRYTSGERVMSQAGTAQDDPFAPEPRSNSQGPATKVKAAPETLRLADLPSEVEHARAYLAVVDDVLGASLDDAGASPTSTQGGTGLGSANIAINLVRSMSLGQALPAWAEAAGFEDDRLGACCVRRSCDQADVQGRSGARPFASRTAAVGCQHVAARS